MAYSYSSPAAGSRDFRSFPCDDDGVVGLTRCDFPRKVAGVVKENSCGRAELNTPADREFLHLMQLALEVNR